MLGFVTRRRYEADLAAAKAETNRQRARAEAAEDTARAETAARRTITRQHAELDAANRRLAGRNLELGQRISVLTEADPTYTAALEQRLDRALKACARWMDAVWVETRHADRLQKRLDDAVGLNTSQIADGRLWQQNRHDKKGVLR